MKRWRGKAEWLLFAVLVAVFFITWLLIKDTTIAVLTPKGVISSQQQTLFVITVGLSILVVVPVFSMLALFAYKYRADKNHSNYQPEWNENTKLEVIWWGIPIAIISILAVVAAVTSHTLDPYREIKADTPSKTVQVVALQWKWLFIYPAEQLATVNYMPLPKGTPISLKLTADAPMSAFWIPSLGSQIYNMNGMTSQLNLLATHVGTYQGYSTNINGEGYADMKFDVPVSEPDAFYKWVKEQHAAKHDMMDMTAFKKLRKPSMNDKPAVYYLGDIGLYDKIVGQYMAGMSHMEHTDDSTMEGMDADTMIRMNHGGQQ